MEIGKEKGERRREREKERCVRLFYLGFIYCTADKHNAHWQKDRGMERDRQDRQTFTQTHRPRFCLSSKTFFQKKRKRKDIFAPTRWAREPSSWMDGWVVNRPIRFKCGTRSSFHEPDTPLKNPMLTIKHSELWKGHDSLEWFYHLKLCQDGTPALTGNWHFLAVPGNYSE